MSSLLAGQVSTSTAMPAGWAAAVATIIATAERKLFDPYNPQLKPPGEWPTELGRLKMIVNISLQSFVNEDDDDDGLHHPHAYCQQLNIFLCPIQSHPSTLHLYVTISDHQWPPPPSIDHMHSIIVIIHSLLNALQSFNRCLFFEDTSQRPRRRDTL